MIPPPISIIAEIADVINEDIIRIIILIWIIVNLIFNQNNLNVSSQIMVNNIEYFSPSLSTLFTLINPVGIAPIFLTLTERSFEREQKSIAKKEF